jgi:hypothetical protein
MILKELTPCFTAIFIFSKRPSATYLDLFERFDCLLNFALFLCVETLYNVSNVLEVIMWRVLMMLNIQE